MCVVARRLQAIGGAHLQTDPSDATPLVDVLRLLQYMQRVSRQTYQLQET